MARASLERGVRLARQLQAFAQASAAGPAARGASGARDVAAGFEDVVGRERIIELRLRHGAAILVDPVPARRRRSPTSWPTRATPRRPGAVIVIDLARVERAAGPSCRIAVMDRGEGHVARGRAAGGRAVLHDPRAGPRSRPRPDHRAHGRRIARRLPRGRIEARLGHDRVALAAGRDGGSLSQRLRRRDDATRAPAVPHVLGSAVAGQSRHVATPPRRRPGPSAPKPRRDPRRRR